MKKFCFTKKELELLQDAIQSWLLNDFSPQCIELQKELEAKKERMKMLYDYIEVLKGETN